MGRETGKKGRCEEGVQSSGGEVSALIVRVGSQGCHTLSNGIRHTCAVYCVAIRAQ